MGIESEVLCEGRISTIGFNSVITLVKVDVRLFATQHSAKLPVSQQYSVGLADWLGILNTIEMKNFAKVLCLLSDIFC